MRFDPASDAEGVRLAMRELMEEDFAYQRVAHRMPGMDPDMRRRMVDGQMPRRTLADGYYRLSGYLMWLGQYVEPGDPRLLSYEGVGLQMLKAARGEFRNDHPPCVACGALQDTRFVTRCCECGFEFKRCA